jgi:hypothetical protein
VHDDALLSKFARRAYRIATTTLDAVGDQDQRAIVPLRAEVAARLVERKGDGRLAERLQAGDRGTDRMPVVRAERLGLVLP